MLASNTLFSALQRKNFTDENPVLHACNDGRRWYMLSFIHYKFGAVISTEFDAVSLL